MKGSTDKCHFIISSNDSSGFKIGNSLIKSSDREEPLGVKIDAKLTFDDHIKDMCRKANSKLWALGRVTPYMSLGKKKLLINSFFAAQFNYCALIWMFYSRSNNSKITRLHERCLRLIYSDNSSSYEELLEREYQSLFTTKIFKLFNWSYGQRPWKIVVNQIILSKFQTYHL